MLRMVGDRVFMVERAHKNSPCWCVRGGVTGKKRGWSFHVSFGLPVWWKPNASRRRDGNFTEWRAGWLLMAVQIATRLNEVSHADR